VKKSYLFILLFFLPSLLFAQQARFDMANDLLDDQQYRDALKLYHEIDEMGYESGALWLNMGYSYSRLDSLGKAKFYLLRSAQYPETESLANEYLVYVNEQFSRRSAVLPQLPWIRFFYSLEEQIGVRGLFFTALFFLNIAAALIIASWFFRNRALLLKRSGLGTLIIAGVVFGAALYANHLNERYGTGVMVDRQGQVFEQADPESAPVSTAYEGYQLQVDYYRSDEADGWYYVRLQNGQYGWIERDGLMVF